MNTLCADFSILCASQPASRILYISAISMDSSPHHLSSSIDFCLHKERSSQSPIPLCHKQHAMSGYNQEQLPVAYPPPPAAYNPSTESGQAKYPSVMAPPPIGYPTRNHDKQEHVPVESTSRGDGFLKGCLAGLCCCCCLDFCF